MRVVEYDQFGGPEVLTLRDRAEPRPGPGQVLVRVVAAALNPKDILLSRGKFRLLSGARFPRRYGFDWAGEVVEVGPGVRDIAPGARMFGMLDGFQGGACAEYLVSDVSRCALAPESIGLTEAAAVPLAALTALQAYRKVARLEAKQRVLVNGASGGVGTFAVQLARALGAEVDATTSKKNEPLLRELGARDVYDYATLDLRMHPKRYDVVFDVFGNLPFAHVRPALTALGLQITTVPSARHVLTVAKTALSPQRFHLVTVKARQSDLCFVASLIDRGQLRPVIDRVLPLAQIAEAQQHLATKHARGKIVLQVGPEPTRSTASDARAADTQK
jgi:NADPH:quinone reductase-like Zn-dependent oxidoreductase